MASRLGSEAPFALEAVVREDDTYNVLSAEPWPRPQSRPLEPSLAEAVEAEPAPPGGVVVREGSPLELLAIVHDLELEPSWREEWIASATAAALREAERRALTSIAFPLLGTRYGAPDRRRVLRLLARALQAGPIGRLRRLWLVLPPDATADGLDVLDGHDLEIRI